MAWLDIPGNANWEYSTTPNTDRKAIDTYDYDAFANHIAGIRYTPAGKIYVLSRQKSVPHPGYGEIYVYGIEIVGSVLMDGEDTSLNGDTDVIF